MITENNIPKKFKIANQWYTIEMVDSIDGGNFGDFDCVRARIRLARNIYSCEEYVKVTEEQMCNTCWHEIFHVFNYHMNNETDETIAQSFANFMREFESSASI